jgi:hypothetical protein
MKEIVFLVERAPEGGYTARAVGESIFTQADDFAALEENVRDAVRCHFEEDPDSRASICVHLRNLRMNVSWQFYAAAFVA